MPESKAPVLASRMSSLGLKDGMGGGEDMIFWELELDDTGEMIDFGDLRISAIIGMTKFGVKDLR